MAPDGHVAMCQPRPLSGTPYIHISQSTAPPATSTIIVRERGNTRHTVGVAAARLRVPVVALTLPTLDLFEKRAAPEGAGVESDVFGAGLELVGLGDGGRGKDTGDGEDGRSGEGEEAHGVWCGVDAVVVWGGVMKCVRVRG